VPSTTQTRTATIDASGPKIPPDNHSGPTISPRTMPVDAKPDDAHLGEVADEQLGRRSRIGEVIEPEVTRTFYVQLAGDDLTLVA